jgi:hypothetical protein
MVTDRPLFSTATATRLLGIDRRGQETEKLLWTDAYEIRRTTRPGGWDSGTTPENVTTAETGVCKLVSNGPGPGDSADGAVIVGLTPFRAKFDAATTLNASTDLLVINGREFLVDDVARGNANKTIVEASLTERNGGAGW